MSVVLVFFVVACDQIEVVPQYDDDGRLIARYSYNMKSGDREGPYEIFLENGQLYETGTYQQDTMHGKRTIFFKDGSPNIIEYYDRGTIHGPYQVYHPNGQIEVDGAFTNGRIEGEWQVYYENGQLKEVVQFKENEENGPFIEYYPNGNLKAEGAYLNGDNEEGELKLYNEEGVLVRIMSCSVGICRTTWSIEEDEEPSENE